MQDKQRLHCPRRAYKNLSLQQLQSFREVCRQGGYASAARILYLTSPAVWEQVRALEEPFGVLMGLPETYSRRRVQEVFHRYNLAETARIAVETSSDEYSLACVRAGLGVGITMGLHQGPLYRGLAVRSLQKWFGSARIGFLWKRGAQVPAIRAELAEFVRAAFARRCGPPGRPSGRR